MSLTLEDRVLQRLRYDAGDVNHPNTYIQLLDIYVADKYRAQLAKECMSHLVNPESTFVETVKLVRAKLQTLYVDGKWKTNALSLVKPESNLPNQQKPPIEKLQFYKTPPEPLSEKQMNEDLQIPDEPKPKKKKEKKKRSTVEKMVHIRSKLLQRYGTYKEEDGDLFNKYDTSFLLTEDDCYPCHIPLQSRMQLYSETILS